MAFGINYGGSGGGGGFLPIIKYDARAGRIFRVDRQDGVNNQVDITKTFKAVVDFENVETGWIMFAAGSAPDFRLVPMRQPVGPKPSDSHKEGVRLVVKLAKECGGDVREIVTTAAAALRGLEKIHDQYEEDIKVAANAGKLPAVILTETVSQTSGSGAKTSTNYQPVFKIVGYVKRPADLVPSPRGGGPTASTGSGRPATTGSTPVGPPVQTQAPLDADDFG